MTRTDLANTPDEASPPPAEVDILARLADVLEAIAHNRPDAEVELQCFTPARAAELLGKTENWVIDAIHDRRIPFTYVGKSPRLTAAHIREIAASGEVKPSRFASGPRRTPRTSAA